MSGSHPASPRGHMPRLEFVALIALLMALTALSIDVMLVALPHIADSFGLTQANDRQLIVTSYLIGFAVGQPFHGPLSDRFGRKPLLVVGLVVFALGTIAAILAPSFGCMLAARALQGAGAAAPRVVAVAVVRDRFAGRQMARVMSFVMMVFIVIPILAPAMGEAVLMLGPWRWIFAVLLLASAVALVWVGRLPETRPVQDRMPLTAAGLTEALWLTLTSRRTLGYTIGSGFMFGAMMSYIGSAQQIFVDVYDLGELFPLMFGAVASAMALASITNARLVGRLGMRNISHAALLALIAAGAGFGLAGFPAHPPLAVLGAFLGVVFFCFGLIVPNFNAMAMEPVGRVAGMASSFIGFYTTAAGAFFGWVIGQAFDGSVRPLTIGIVILALLTLVAVLATEKGRLMHRAGQS